MFPDQPVPESPRCNHPGTARLLRLPQVLQYFPISKSAWWAGIKEGRYPKPVRIGTRSVAWRESEINRLIQLCESSSNGFGQQEGPSEKGNPEQATGSSLPMPAKSTH